MNLSISCRNSLEDVLSQEVFIIKSVEVTTFTFIRELWRIEEHISIGVGPTTMEVPINSLNVV